jgi:hypothetical protein
VSGGIRRSAGSDTLRCDSHQVLIITRFCLSFICSVAAGHSISLLLNVAEFHE